jgi:hypothetical protein
MGAKKTFTYATDPEVKEKAARKAYREKLTLSEKIDQMLREYVKPVPKAKTTKGPAFTQGMSINGVG